MKRSILLIALVLTGIQSFALDELLLAKVLHETHTYVQDVNADGKVNCIDYSLTFKKFWDWIAPDGYSMNCEIVHNVNKQKNFNHLFIRIRTNSLSEWVCIEPQATIQNYNMEKYWGTRYNPQYNIYGETYIWMLKQK